MKLNPIAEQMPKVGPTMSLTEIEDEEIHDYLTEKYHKISNVVIRCVITHLSILKEVKQFSSKDDLFNQIDAYAFQFMDLVSDPRI